jgi:hypothetical protein
MVTPEESRRQSQTVQIAQHHLQPIKSDVHWFVLRAVAKAKNFVPEHQPIMCDFEVVKHDSSSARFYITLVLEMENSRDTEHSLSFSMSTVTEFEYRPEDYPTALPEGEDERWHLFYTGLSAAISTARGYLTNYLAPTIYRGYLLPLLDVKALIDRKYIRPALPSVPSSAPSEKPPTKPKKKGSE